MKQYYCANKDILLTYNKFQCCRKCTGKVCKTCLMTEMNQNEMVKLVDEYKQRLRTKKLNRIL